MKQRRQNFTAYGEMGAITMTDRLSHTYLSHQPRNTQTGEAHAFFNGAVDTIELIHCRFIPLATMLFQNSLALFSQASNILFRSRRAVQIQQSVGDGDGSRMNCNHIQSHQSSSDSFGIHLYRISHLHHLVDDPLQDIILGRGNSNNRLVTDLFPFLNLSARLTGGVLRVPERIA